jgi:hypothetical protein
MTRAITLLLCALALVVAGCGSSDKKNDSSSSASTPSTTSTSSALSKSEYKTKVTVISQDFAAAGQAFKNSVSAQSTPQQAATALQAFQTKVRKDANDLSKLNPPASVATPHQKLVTGFRAVADACQPSIDAGRKGDRTALRTALKGLQAQLNGSLGQGVRQAATEIDAGLK